MNLKFFNLKLIRFSLTGTASGTGRVGSYQCTGTGMHALQPALSLPGGPVSHAATVHWQPESRRCQPQAECSHGARGGIMINLKVPSTPPTLRVTGPWPVTVTGTQAASVSVTCL